MEVNKIDEASQMASTKDVDAAKIRGKTCIYDTQKICCAPRLTFKVCRSCPRAAQYIRQNVVQNIFGKIKGLAITMMNMMGGSSVGGGSAGGAGGAGGGGGGGGGG